MGLLFEAIVTVLQDYPWAYLPPALLCCALAIALQRFTWVSAFAIAIAWPLVVLFAASLHHSLTSGDDLAADDDGDRGLGLFAVLVFWVCGLLAVTAGKITGSLARRFALRVSG